MWIGRRQSLAGLPALGCGFLDGQAEAQETPEFERIELHLGGADACLQTALVIVPRHLDARVEHPALILLHGYAPGMSPDRSFRTWKDDYGVEDSYRRCLHAPLQPRYPRQHLFEPTRLARLNDQLSARPLRGMVLVCPVTPVPYLNPARLDHFADWVRNTLLPAVRKVAPIATARQRVGLAGVSMGGRAALELLLRAPDLFGAFSGLQIDIKLAETPTYAASLAEVIERKGPVRLCIQTSTLDGCRSANELLSEECASRGLHTELLVSPGYHNKAWLRELAGIETLCFQDRALAVSDERADIDLPTLVSRIAN